MARLAAPWATALLLLATSAATLAAGAAVASSAAPALLPASCLAVSPEEILQQVRRAAVAQVELALSLEATFLLLTLSLAQCELGVTGAIGELGSTWAGGSRGSGDESFLSFHTLSLFRRADDPLFLNGPFLGTDGDGYELPEVNFDPSADACVGRVSRRVQRLGGPPTTLTTFDLRRHSDGAGFRILRLDRAREGNETLRLLRAASGSLVQGGLLLLEGIQGMSDRPGLQEGFHRFMLEGKHQLVPFLWAGKRGGLFMADKDWAETYRDSVRKALPYSAFLNAVYDTKFLYGSRLLTTIFEAQPAGFEALLRRVGPPDV